MTTRTAVVIRGPAEAGLRDWTQIGDTIEHDDADADITEAVADRLAEHLRGEVTIYPGDQIRVLDTEAAEEAGIDLRGWQ